MDDENVMDVEGLSDMISHAGETANKYHEKARKMPHNATAAGDKPNDSNPGEADIYCTCGGITTLLKEGWFGILCFVQAGVEWEQCRIIVYHDMQIHSGTTSRWYMC